MIMVLLESIGMILINSLMKPSQLTTFELNNLFYFANF